MLLPSGRRNHGVPTGRRAGWLRRRLCSPVRRLIPHLLHWRSSARRRPRPRLPADRRSHPPARRTTTFWIGGRFCSALHWLVVLLPTPSAQIVPSTLIGTAMATAGVAVHLWKAWGIQILVLVSFSLQVFLLIFAGIRRRSASTALRILLWLTYLLADNVSVYALGHMSLSSRPQEDRLIAFWAPFFLLHLGGQDTITAYSLEDNQLWKRHLLTLVVQVSGAAYILYLYVAGAGALIPAAFVMFMLGVIKYGERVWVLKCANMENHASSLDIPAGEYGRIDRRGNLGAEEELLLGAHYMFSLCRSEFVD